MKKIFTCITLVFIGAMIAMGQDSDCDGMSDADEDALSGYDKFDNDSDDDGVSDGAQFAWGGGPDTDFDGLPDYAENPDWGSMTDPLIADTDGDGLCDGYEGTYGVGAPLQADIDGDGLNDSVEVAHGTLYANPDSDDDGLNDSLEIFHFGTNPLDQNTDGDCLGDSTEVAESLDPRDSTDAILRDWFVDADDDGHGLAGASMSTCFTPAGYALLDDDCDDEDSTKYPGAEEVPNDGIDQDCNGEDLIVTGNYSGSRSMLHVFPNPVYGQFMLTSVNAKINSWRLLDSYGKQVANKVGLSTHEEKVSVGQLEKGVYFVEIMLDNGTSQTKRIVKD